jgi:chromosome segregation ATPase
MALEDLDVRAQVSGDVVNCSARREQGDIVAVEDELKYVLQQCEEARKERDILLEEYNLIEEKRDKMRLEIQRLIDLCQKVAELQEQLNVVRDEYEDMMKERDSYRLRARNSEASCEAMTKLVEEKTAEAQKMKVQSKSVGRLQNKLDSERQQHADIVKDRDHYGEIAQREEACKNAIKIRKNAVKVEIEKLKAKVKETDLLEENIHMTETRRDNNKREGTILKSRVKWMTADRDSMIRDRDALKAEIDQLRPQGNEIEILEEKLNAQRQESESIKRENKGLILKLQRTSAQGDALKEERQALQREKEQLRGLCRNCSALDRELNANSRHCTVLEKERKALDFVAKRAAAEVDSIRKKVENLRLATGSRRSGREEIGANALELETL